MPQITSAGSDQAGDLSDDYDSNGWQDETISPTGGKGRCDPGLRGGQQLP